jgi:hypothetical protein
MLARDPTAKLPTVKPICAREISEFQNCALNFGGKLALLMGGRVDPIRQAGQIMLPRASDNDE